MNASTALEFCPEYRPLSNQEEVDKVGNCTKDVISKDNSAHRFQMLEQPDAKMTTEFDVNLEEYQQWEISTEIQLKRMEKNLKEAQMTIETQRSSLVDLQLQNESLTQKLGQGRTTEDAIYQKVDEMWEFYNFVERYTSKLDEQLKTYEQCGLEVQQFHKIKSQEIETLVAGFKELQVKHEGSCNTLLMECKEKEQLQLVTEYNDNSQRLENKIKDFEAQLMDKDDKIQYMVLELKSFKDKIAVLEDEKDRFKDTVKNNENTIETQEKNLKENSTKINELEIFIKEKEELLQKTTDDLNDMILAKQNLHCELEQLEKSLNKTIEDSREQMTKTNAILTENISRIECLVEQQQKLENENDDLKIQKDSLLMENTNLNKHLKETQDSYNCTKEMFEKIKSEFQDVEVQNQELRNTCMQVDELKNELKMKEEIVSQVNEKKEQLQLEIDAMLHSQQLLTNEIEAFKTKIADYDERFVNLKNEYENIQRSYEAEKLAKQTLSDKMQPIQESNEALHLQLNSCQNQLACQETELQELRVRNNQEDVQLKSLQEQIKICETEIQNWKVKSEESDKKVFSTLQDTQAKSSRIDKLESKLHVAVALQKRAKAMKCEIAEKMQYINELEKKIMVLNGNQSDHAIEKLNLCDKINSLTEEIQILNNRIKQLSDDSNNKINHLETTLNERNKRIFEMENEAKIQKESFERLQLEKKFLTEKCENNKVEFFSTLSSYKMSNQRIVSDKEKEIASFRAEMEKTNEKHEVELRKTQRDLLKLQVSLENAKCQIETEKSQKEDSEKMNHELQCQITVMKNELNNKFQKCVAELTRNCTTDGLSINPVSIPTHHQADKDNTPKTYEKTISTSLKESITPIDNRKHVTFSKLPSSCDSETSISDGMEISSIIPAQKVKGKVVSPCTISFRSATPNSQSSSLSPGMTSPYLKQASILSEPKTISRGNSVEFTPNAKKLKIDPKMPATPRKGIAKIFKVTQGERKTFWSEKKKKSEENLKWFDLDGRFSFDDEV